MTSPIFRRRWALVSRFEDSCFRNDVYIHCIGDTDHRGWNTANLNGRLYCSDVYTSFLFSSRRIRR